MIGFLASSKAGHDKDKIYVIIKEDAEYVWLADGKLKTLELPKKKRKKHIQLIKCFRDDRMLHSLKEGTAIIQYLEYDNYYVIEEVEAPKGHSLPSKEDDRFTIVHIGANTTVIEDTEMKFVNYPTPYTFYKFDEYNNLLDGAKFKLQKLNENKSYVTVKVSKVEGEESLYKAFEGENEIIETTNGKATVYYLEEGQYRIVEVEAAEGKELPKKTINVATFFVDKEGKVYGENIITNKKPTEKTYIKPEAKANLIITIQTGQTVVKYGLIIAVLIAGITGLMILLRKRK